MPQGNQQDIERIGSAEVWKVNYTLTAQDKQAFERSPQRWTREFLERRGQTVNDVIIVPGAHPVSADTCFSSASGDPTMTHLSNCKWVII